MQIIPFNIQHQFLGLTCKLSENAPSLSETYLKVLGIGYNIGRVRQLYWWCNYENLCFVFVNEQPIQKGAETFYCVEEVGENFGKDWHWFTLAQLELQNDSLLQGIMTNVQDIRAQIDALNAQIKALPLLQVKELVGKVNKLNKTIKQTTNKNRRCEQD